MDKLEEKNIQAIKTLIIGCRLAQKEGVYTLEEARTIVNAVDTIKEVMDD
tara:strand:+ start:223 stop:372 length:150 start_codon:yes stop_codon:yes gene_type:complete